MNVSCGLAVKLSNLDRWRNLVSYQGILMGCVCAVVSLALLWADASTRKGIAARQMEDRLAELAQVMPKDLYDNNPVKNVFTVRDPIFQNDPVEVYPACRHGHLVAVAFQAVTMGYGGPISLMMGVDAGGSILGVRILSHRETPGLADKIEIAKSPWILEFNNRSLHNTSTEQWAVKKDGGVIDQFSGATITPRAVVKGIHAGLLFFERNKVDIVRTVTAVTAESKGVAKL